jgi:hypothetical protein
MTNTCTMPINCTMHSVLHLSISRFNNSHISVM